MDSATMKDIAQLAKTHPLWKGHRGFSYLPLAESRTDVLTASPSSESTYWRKGEDCFGRV